MYGENIDNFALVGASKARHLSKRPPGFIIGAAMAGAYIGFGDLIMFTAGAHAGPAFAHLVMGAVFAGGLTFVVFAGSELFTGTAMYMPFALFRGKVGIPGLIGVWAACWLGNLIGSVLLAAVFKMAGGGVLLTDGSQLFFNAVQAKMAGSAESLFAKGLLCNWLVCLAIWMCGRTKSDAAKLGLIFWPILVFVACGFEHSVANMFAFSLALMVDHPASITLQGAMHNELWVTLGNLAGGAVFMALGYWAQGDAAGHPSHSAIGGAVTNPRAS